MQEFCSKSKNEPGYSFTGLEQSGFSRPILIPPTVGYGKGGISRGRNHQGKERKNDCPTNHRFATLQPHGLSPSSSLAYSNVNVTICR
jgi:hypothetical protein